MEKLWLKHYPDYVPPEIDVEVYSSINDAFDKCSAKFLDKPALSNFGKTITYREEAKYVEMLASYFQNVLKLKKGDRVALMMPNIIQYPIGIFAVLKAGGVVVNVNPLYTPRELEHQLNDAQVDTIIVLENFANTLELVLPKTKVKNIIVATIGDMLGGVKGAIVNFAVRHVKKMVPNYRFKEFTWFKDCLKQGAEHKFNPVECKLDEVAFLQYTGGTTGVAKGAMLTHGNVCANMLQAYKWVSKDLKEGEEVVLAPLPLYHIFSMTINLMLFTVIGGHNVLITNPRDFKSMLKDVASYPFTVFIGVNTLYDAMINSAEFKAIPLPGLKLCFAGGMAVQKSVANRWYDHVRKPIVNAYGLTEASPGVCVNRLDLDEFVDAIGYPIPNTEVSVRENGEEVPTGETGELWVKGPQVMKGYWNNPEETAKAFDKDGFLATGDIVRYISGTGLFQIVDRKKDMVVVSGFNVYPNEVEDVVTMMDKVQEAACVGVPSEKTGEALKLFVVKRDESLTEKEIIDYCRTQLTAYKVPKIIEFRDELPKTNVGKILRRALKEGEEEA